MASIFILRRLKHNTVIEFQANGLQYDTGVLKNCYQQG